MHNGLWHDDPLRDRAMTKGDRALLSSAEEWNRNEGQMTPSELEQEMNRQRGMAGDPGHASVGPPESRMSSIWNHLRHGIPRRVERFLEPETPAEMAGLLGASVAEPYGTAIDLADFAIGVRDRDPARMGLAAAGAVVPFAGAAGIKGLLRRRGAKAVDVPEVTAPVESVTPSLTPQERAAAVRAEGRATARMDPDIGPAARRSEKRFLHHTGTPERIAAIEREIERGLAIVPEELAQFRNASPRLRSEMVESYLRGPRPNTFADTILAGASGKGWYDISGEGIAESFGDDAPRFTALLAAQSPNKSVEDNLKYALDTWARWNEAGRPAELTRESARSLIASPLPADFDNSILALNADAGALLRGEVKLSGPKVDPFNLDLMGNVNKIVQDTHQSRGYGVAQSRIGNVGVNLPMNAMVRNAAAIASRRVGVDLTSANAQEMGWGWIRGLTNAAGRDGAVSALRASQANPDLPMAGKDGFTLAQRVGDNVALGDLMGRPEFFDLMRNAGVKPPQPRSTPGLGVEIPSGAVRPSALLDIAARIQANKMNLPLLGVGGLLGAGAATSQRERK